MSTIRTIRNVLSTVAIGFWGYSLAKRLAGGRPKAAGSLEGQSWEGTVTRVVDGDTVFADFGRGPIRLRLAHIDAPEHGQRGGQEAQVWLETVLGNHPSITVKPVEMDYYGRVVADIHHNGSWLNFWLVRSGMAWALPSDAVTDIAEAQVAAQAEKQGLWSESCPTPPWLFRKEQERASCKAV